MCTVNNRHKVVFEIDTGASCNILPFVDYVKATGDKQGTHISPTITRLTMHNNTNAIPVGKVMLNVERGSKKHYLRFFVMKSAVMPILGKSTYIGMRLIKFLDCDNRVAKLLKPLHTGDSVRMKLRGSNTWSCGICRKQVAPRSYLVESNGSVYRHNRRQLRKTSDKLPVHQPDIELADSDSETGEEKGNEQVIHR